MIQLRSQNRHNLCYALIYLEIRNVEFKSIKKKKSNFCKRIRENESSINIQMIFLVTRIVFPNSIPSPTHKQHCFRFEMIDMIDSRINKIVQKTPFSNAMNSIRLRIRFQPCTISFFQS